MCRSDLRLTRVEQPSVAIQRQPFGPLENIRRDQKRFRANAHTPATAGGTHLMTHKTLTHRRHQHLVCVCASLFAGRAEPSRLASHASSDVRAAQAVCGYCQKEDGVPSVSCAQIFSTCRPYVMRSQANCLTNWAACYSCITRVSILIRRLHRLRRLGAHQLS